MAKANMPRNREHIDDGAFLVRKRVQPIADEWLDGRWEEVGLFFEARIIADELTFAVGVRVEELERATFEEGVDHLEQEVRIAPNAGHEFTAHVAYASPHPKARLDEAHLLVGRESDAVGKGQGENHLADTQAIWKCIVDSASVDVALAAFAVAGEVEATLTVENQVVGTMQGMAVAGGVERIHLAAAQVDALYAAASVVGGLAARAQ